ncbi:MAG: von Willebrand factor, type [Bryobacterales bacterium]|nr:von Willebrand factor, type [Bryobacterales bacterium]
MRLTAMAFIAVCTSPAQFTSNVPLVLAPVSVVDGKGHYVDGLTSEDLILYDNNVPQKIQLDWSEYPISLVVAVQASANSGAVIDKLGSSGILFSQLLAAHGGETAMISFSDDIRLHQDFTGDSDKVTGSLRMLRKEGDGAHILDALEYGLAMLEKRPAGRRRIMLVIAEKRDRSSEQTLPAVMARAQRTNVTVYWLTWSPFLQPFTVKPKTMEDLKPEATRIKKGMCAGCRQPDDRGAPFDAGPGSAIYAIGELARLQQPDLSGVFTRTTGGRTLNFLKKGALEEAVQLVAQEVHRQYLVTFQPRSGSDRAFHTVRAVVRDRPELVVRTREGYWPVD